MLLLELAPETGIIFELEANGQKYEFSSRVKGKDKNVIFTDPIRIDGKILNFDTASVNVNLIMNRQDKSPIIWKSVAISIVSGKNGAQYKVTSSRDGYEINRRNAFRLFVGIDGVVQMGANRKAIDIIVKDVSDTGFSFVSEENEENIIEKPVRLVFSDLNQNFSLVGIVVRKVVISEKKILYGCSLSVPNKNLGRYINEKQRQMLSMNKNNSVSKDKALLEASLKENHRDESTEKDLKKMIKSDGVNKRDITTVGKVERRNVFKDNHVGKKV